VDRISWALIPKKRQLRHKLSKTIFTFSFIIEEIEEGYKFNDEKAKIYLDGLKETLEFLREQMKDLDLENE